MPGCDPIRSLFHVSPEILLYCQRDRVAERLDRFAIGIVARQAATHIVVLAVGNNLWLDPVRSAVDRLTERDEWFAVAVASFANQGTALDRTPRPAR